MTDDSRWVIDTVAYTHLCRAGHGNLLRDLAPGGIVVVPAEVHAEIEKGRNLYPSIPAVEDVDWAELTVLDDAEVWISLEVKATLAGTELQHLGECAVIACAKNRGYLAVLDDGDGTREAEARDVPSINTLWIVIEAFKTILDRDHDKAARIVDDLLDTEMYLPITSGESLFTWAYEQGYLP